MTLNEWLTLSERRWSDSRERYRGTGVRCLPGPSVETLGYFQSSLREAACETGWSNFRTALRLARILSTPHETATAWSAGLRPALGVASATSRSQTGTPPNGCKISGLEAMPLGNSAPQSRRDFTRIAQRFNAGSEPSGAYESHRDDVVPAGLVPRSPGSPALKRWAIFGRPSGTGR